MKTFVVHDRNGDVTTLVTCSPDAPPLAIPLTNGQQVTEMDINESISKLTAPKNEKDAVEKLRSLRVEAGAIVSKNVSP